jgi:hypothetical protein
MTVIFTDRTDLTPLFLEAKSKIERHSVSQLFESLKRIADERHLQLAWDKDDGEQWGRLLDGDKVILMFHSSLPILFVDSSEENVYNHFLTDALTTGMTLVRIESWNAKNFSLNIELANDILPWNSAIFAGEISIDDLWYATV